MRKKSHISLARFLVCGAEDEVLSRRWRAFYAGNLLPDCRPAFLTTRHEYEETIELVERKLRSLVSAKGYASEDSFRYVLDLGQVFHYIADYFTFPHNRHYPGGLREHCAYEEFLKLRLRSYLREDAAEFCRDGASGLQSVDEILAYLKEKHQEYSQRMHSVDEDCEYITQICSRILSAVVRLTRPEMEPALATV